MAQTPNSFAFFLSLSLSGPYRQNALRCHIIFIPLDEKNVEFVPFRHSFLLFYAF